MRKQTAFTWSRLPSRGAKLHLHGEAEVAEEKPKRFAVLRVSATFVSPREIDLQLSNDVSDNHL